jgi:hypothetical protein
MQRRAFSKGVLKVGAVTAGMAGAAVAANVVRGGGFGRGGLVVGGGKGPNKPPLGSTQSGAHNLNGVLRMPSGARIPHNINFDHPPTRSGGIVNKGPIATPPPRKAFPMGPGPIGRAATAAASRPRPNYGAAVGRKENLRIREVPLRLGTINGKKI